MQQAVLRELCGMLDPHTFDFVSDRGELNEVMTAALQGLGNEATPSNCATLSGKKLWEAMDVIEALKHVAIVGDRARSDDDSSPENGSVQKIDGIANWVLTAAKGKEQDDDDVDEEDEDGDGDDDDVSHVDPDDDGDNDGNA